MRLSRGALFLAVVVPVASVAAAPPLQADGAVAEARLGRARSLAALATPPSLLLEANVKGWEAAMSRSLELNPAIATLESRYPGIAKAAVEAARPLARIYCQRFVAEVLEHKARLLAERLEIVELDMATAFFASPAGKRVVLRMLGNFDPLAMGAEVADRAASSGTSSISVERVREIERGAANAAMTETSADDHVALLRCQQNPVSAKYAAVALEADNYAIERANHPDPEWLRKQGEIVNAALLAFVDAKEKL